MSPPFLARISRPALVLIGLAGVAAVLAGAFGLVAAGQATLNGLVAGSYLGLGAIGLTLVFGVLRLVNFAHGDLLTAGAYFTIGLSTLGLPLALAVPGAIAATALLAYATESLVWRRMREARAGSLQLFLTAIGLALVIRFSIQFVSGGQARTLGIDILSSFEFGGMRLGMMQGIVLVSGMITMGLVGLMLRHTLLGKQMRAYADNRALAEVSGVETRRIVIVTWLLSGSLAGLAGLLYAAAIGTFNPNFGLTLLLSLFAAAILGGIGNAYGALVGGLIIGLSQEWATLFFNPRWKPSVGFVILILTLLVLPQGIFGKTRRKS
ncbi:MAG: branched-chain amino acid ABC transporter permease [Betaproteobacteria bacterium]